MPTDLKPLILVLEAPDGRSWRIPADKLMDLIDSNRGGMHFATPTTPRTLLGRVVFMNLTSMLAYADHIDLAPADLLAWVGTRPSGTIPEGYAFRLEGGQNGLGPVQLPDLIDALTRAKTSDDPNSIIDQVIYELQKPAETTGAPAPEDGWGHTTKDASTEDLLREGAAAAEGTDKHEQVIRKLLGEDNEKAAIELLRQLVSDLQRFQEMDIKPFMYDLRACRAKERAEENAAREAVARHNERVRRMLSGSMTFFEDL